MSKETAYVLVWLARTANCAISEIAEEAGISTTSVRNVLSGRSRVTKKVHHALTKWKGYDPSFFQEGDTSVYVTLSASGIKVLAALKATGQALLPNGHTRVLPKWVGSGKNQRVWLEGEPFDIEAVEQLLSKPLELPEEDSVETPEDPVLSELDLGVDLSLFVERHTPEAEEVGQLLEKADKMGAPMIAIIRAFRRALERKRKVA